jgi:hypothetical protein
MSMLENSNKSLHLEINKVRKEMDYYKKLSKMFENKFNIKNLKYSDENVALVNDQSKFNEFIDSCLR